MEQKFEGIKQFEVNMNLVEEAYIQLPLFLNKFAGIAMKNQISTLVPNYEVFISEISLISSLIISGELTEDNLDLLKNNYEPLSILLGDKVILLDNLIVHLTPKDKLTEEFVKKAA